jgi:predicted helicase
MVSRVDTVLRTELGISDGLADPNVYVLDPACGTAGYPLEVLRQIAKTLKENGTDALLAYDLKKAAMERVFGFEILSAPYVISHLQVGLLLQQYGAELEETERAAIFLTNSLTGWEPPKGPKQLVAFKEFEAERDAADKIKQQVPILVILGNPPYNAFSGVAQTEEEKDLIRPYKDGLIEKWGIKKFNLDDLYIRFFRLAERRIVEQTNRGIVCFISNFSYLSDASYVVMRQRFLKGFDTLWFDSLNGDSRETGKLTPEGKPDPSVFSTPTNKEGIRVGTAIGLMVRKDGSQAKPEVRFRHFWGGNKREELLVSLQESDINGQYMLADPKVENRFSFRPSSTSSEYYGWPRMIDLCAEPPSNGLMEKRAGALMDSDRLALKKRMQMYYDPTTPWEDLTTLDSGLTKDAAGFDAKKARTKVQTAEKYQDTRIQRYALRPFDTRWCYYSDVNPLWNRARPSLWAQCWEGNQFFLTRFKCAKEPEGPPFFFTRLLSDDHFLAPDAVAIPSRLRSVSTQKGQKHQITFLDKDAETIKANLSSQTRAYLQSIGIGDIDADNEITSGIYAYELVWMHCLAIGFSPAYLQENGNGIRQDWPHVPLPATRDELITSAALGKAIAALLDSEQTVYPVTTGVLPQDLKTMGILTRTGGGALNPVAGDLAITAGWGHLGQDGAVMPGSGRVVKRAMTPSERYQSETTTLDIYLNYNSCWQNIPSSIWEYTIGGYQVIKKWLSYREKDVLKRDLTVEEARYVTDMVRRIATLIMMEPDLDKNYQAVVQNTYHWR